MFKYLPIPSYLHSILSFLYLSFAVKQTAFYFPNMQTNKYSI